MTETTTGLKLKAIAKKAREEGLSNDQLSRAVRFSYEVLGDVRVEVPLETLDVNAMRDSMVSLSQQRYLVKLVMDWVAPAFSLLRERREGHELEISRISATMLEDKPKESMTKIRSLAMKNPEAYKFFKMSMEDRLRLDILEGLVSHVKYTRDEVKAGYDTVSRILATIELERR